MRKGECWDAEILGLRATPLKRAGSSLRFEKIKDGENERLRV